MADRGDTHYRVGKLNLWFAGSSLFLLLNMMSMPIKMFLRWTFNLKYIVAIPEYFFNI